MKQGWEYKKFETCINKTPKPKQVKTEDYNSGTKYPIVSQEDKLISGYYDDESYVFHIDSPVVIFGDHTRVLKYVDFDFVVGADGVKIISPKQDLNAKFLLYYLQWYKIPNLGYSRHYKLLKELNIPLPPKSTQLAIVSELDKINELIRLKKEQLKDLDKLAQSIFYEMFGDPVENEKGWEVKMLGDVCTDITDGDHMPPPKSEYGIPFITISDIDKESRSLNFENTYYVPIDYYNKLKENRKARIGDLLYTVTGSYGIPVIVKTDKQFCFQRHIALLRPNIEILSTIFLYYWMLNDGVKFMADKVAKGIAQKTVGLNSIRKFSCILPPLHLQHLFAHRIEQIEHQKSEVQKAITDLETLLASRMQYWFE